MYCSNWEFGNVSLVALPVRRGGNGRDEMKTIDEEERKNAIYLHRRVYCVKVHALSLNNSTRFRQRFN